MKKFIAASVLSFVFLLCGFSSAQGATRTVDTVSDSGALTACTAAANDCSLRGAVAASATGDTINFSSALNYQTITLTSEITITQGIVISGPGANLLTISGSGNNNRHFYINAGSNRITVSGLTLQNGNGGGTGSTSQILRGGSIYNFVGFLILDGVQMQNNRATDGGAVDADDTVVITNSTLINNTANAAGGAVALYTKILDVTNSTFSGNSTGVNGWGGAIYINGNNTNSILRNVTITNNSSLGNGNGGGLALATTSQMRVVNSVIAGNTASTNPNVGGTGSITNLGYNILSGDPMLAPLANNGGTTDTFLPLCGSPLINAGDPNNDITTDQRGLPRPVEGRSDIGALEKYTLTVSPATLPNGVVGDAYTQTLAASCGVAPYNFSVSAGALPNGLALQQNGTLAGTPTAAGTFNFTITTTAANGIFALTDYKVSVWGISPATLPGTYPNQFYSQQMTATGGTAPYIYQIVSGSLPTGLNFTSGGLLSGTPTQTGVFNIGVRVLDASGISVVKNYSLFVGYYVTNANSSGAGSLRQVINDTPTGGTILFDQTFFNQPRTITGLYHINKNLTINGPGANLLTIDANNAGRVLGISGVTVNLSGIRFTRGRVVPPDASGAGIVVFQNSTLNASGIVVDNCSAPNADGGGFFVDGTLNLTDSTVENNSASGSGGIYIEAGRTATLTRSIVRSNTATSGSGGIGNNGTLNFYDSTLSGNTAPLGGGLGNGGFANFANSTVSGNRSTTNKGAGIYNSSGSTLHLLNTTITNNQADSFAGAGIWNENFGNPTITVRARNTIIAGNSSGAGNPMDYVGDMVNLGNNLINNPNPRLAPLGNYGGATPTHALLSDSPALNAGDNCALTANTCGIAHSALMTDQRGTNSQRKIGAQVDIGAFERNITLDQTTLPNGENTTPYNQQLTVTRATSFVDLLSISDLSERLITEILAAPFTFSVVTISGQQLPPGLSLSSSGVLSGTPTQTGTFTFTIKAADSDGMAGVGQVTLTIVAFNNAPTITGATISRQAGSPVSNSTIATNVNDVEIGANNVTVTITGANPSNGVTVSNIVNTNGTVTANVLAGCSATNATFTLRASDGNKTTNSTLTVNVSTNTQPTLVYTTPQTVLPNNSLNVSPTTATDNGTVSYSLLSVVPSMTTAPTVNSSTGVVSITNANPLGTYTITVRATDNCGATTNASFTLSVELPIKTVTKIADTDDGVCDADCSLREAIATAASDYSIEFASPLFDTLQTITLVNGNLYVPNKTLTINGKGAQLTIISGNNQSRVFNNDNSNLTLNGLTITNGKDPVAVGGGGIYTRGTMTINNCIVSNNSSVGGNGGGIYNNSSFLTINNSTISTNTSSGNNGGGIYLNSLSQLVINNSTISGNSTTNSGGGIYTNQSNLRINNSTITANSSSDGGGIYDFITDKYIQNTIIAGNSAPTFPDLHVLGGAFFMNNSNLIGGDSRLAPLGFYGGATQTHALLPNSPALNTGNNCVLTANACASFNSALTTDQRGTNAQRKIGTQVDIGAFEQNITFDQTSLPDNNQTFSYNQTLTVTRAISFARSLSTTDKKDISESNTLLAPFTFSIVTIAGQQLPPGLSLTSSGTISGTTTTPGAYTFTVKAADADGMAGISQFTINVLAFNNPPTISGATISRQAGSAVSNSTIADVNDFENGASGVTVTVTSANPSNGVTVSNIVNTNGTVTADVIAGCGAGNANFTLTASDGSKTTNATLTVTVSANTQPTIAYPSPVDVVQGDSINISPLAATDNGSIVSYTLVSVSPALPTVPTVNSSGVVSIVNAQPLGSYTIRVRATDNCGMQREATFVLNVIQMARIVTKTEDTNDGVCDSDCSLREAVAVAGAGSPIKFSSLFDTPQTITLTSQIVNGKSLTIDGSGKFVTISGNNQTALFRTANANILMTFVALTLTGGNSTDEANGGGAISIGSSSQVYLINSTVSNNVSSTVGGAIFAPGGARLTVINSTITGNSTNLYGGGIFCNFGSIANLINSTISNNLAGGNGGGINSNNATVNVRNTIIAGNRGVGPDVMGLLTSQGNNLIGNTSGTNIVGDTTGNILNQNAKFAPLGNYGGAIQTYALMPDSPAINAGNNCVTDLTCATNNPPFTIISDERGAMRKIGAAVDIGAFEQSITFSQSNLPNTSTSLTYNQTLTVTRQSSFVDTAYNKQSNENLAPFIFEIVSIAGQSLPPGLTLNPNGQITGQATTQGTFTFTIKATDSADGMSGVHQFVIQVFPPTAATASVSGRVLTPDGRGLANAIVVLTDSQGNNFMTRTSSLGYYGFETVEVGQSYILSVKSKRYQFTSQFVMVTGEMTDLILMAQP